MVIPFIATIGETKTQDISFNSIFTGATSSTLKGVPWRVWKITYSYSNSGFIISDSKEVPSDQPAFFQISLNSAATDNVESINSKRYLSTVIVQKGRMFPLKPNPWKEDEDRDQALITIDNITLGGSAPNTAISVLIHVFFEFGRVPFTHPATMLHNHSRAESQTSASPYSRVSLEDM